MCLVSKGQEQKKLDESEKSTKQLWRALKSTTAFTLQKSIPLLPEQPKLQKMNMNIESKYRLSQIGGHCHVHNEVRKKREPQVDDQTWRLTSSQNEEFKEICGSSEELLDDKGGNKYSKFWQPLSSCAKNMTTRGYNRGAGASCLVLNDVEYSSSLETKKIKKLIPAVTTSDHLTSTSMPSQLNTSNHSLCSSCTDSIDFPVDISLKKECTVDRILLSKTEEKEYILSDDSRPIDRFSSLSNICETTFVSTERSLGYDMEAAYDIIFEYDNTEISVAPPPNVASSVMYVTDHDCSSISSKEDCSLQNVRTTERKSKDADLNKNDYCSVSRVSEKKESIIKSVNIDTMIPLQLDSTRSNLVHTTKQDNTSKSDNYSQSSKRINKKHDCSSISSKEDCSLQNVRTTERKSKDADLNKNDYCSVSRVSEKKESIIKSVNIDTMIPLQLDSTRSNLVHTTKQDNTSKSDNYSQSSSKVNILSRENKFSKFQLPTQLDSSSCSDSEDSSKISLTPKSSLSNKCNSLEITRMHLPTTKPPIILRLPSQDSSSSENSMESDLKNSDRARINCTKNLSENPRKNFLVRTKLKCPEARHQSDRLFNKQGYISSIFKMTPKHSASDKIKSVTKIQDKPIILPYSDFIDKLEDECLAPIKVVSKPKKTRIFCSPIISPSKMKKSSQIKNSDKTISPCDLTDTPIKNSCIQSIENQEKLKNSTNLSSVSKSSLSLDILCNVCLSGDSPEEDPIVLCDGPFNKGGCPISVHKSCYRIKICLDSTEYWRCDVCEERRRGETSIVSCSICLRPEGAIKMFINHSAKLWVHLLCYFWSPLYATSLRLKEWPNSAFSGPFLSKEKLISDNRNNLKCKFCSKPLAVKCASSVCITAAHPHCALNASQENTRWTLIYGQKYSNSNTETKSKYLWMQFCANHNTDARNLMICNGIKMDSAYKKIGHCIDTKLESARSLYISPSCATRKRRKNMCGTLANHKKSRFLGENKFLDIEAVAESDNDDEERNYEECDTSVGSFINDTSQLGYTPNQLDKIELHDSSASPEVFSGIEEGALHRKFDNQKMSTEQFTTPMFHRSRLRGRANTIHKGTNSSGIESMSSNPSSDQALGKMTFIKSVIEHHQCGGRASQIENEYHSILKDINKETKEKNYAPPDRGLERKH